MIFTKKPEILLGGALCHKLTIYKQISTHKLISTKSIKQIKKKSEKREKSDFWHPWYFKALFGASFQNKLKKSFSVYIDTWTSSLNILVSYWASRNGTSLLTRNKRKEHLTLVIRASDWKFFVFYAILTPFRGIEITTLRVVWSPPAQRPVDRAG